MAVPGWLADSKQKVVFTTKAGARPKDGGADDEKPKAGGKGGLPTEIKVSELVAKAKKAVGKADPVTLAVALASTAVGAILAAVLSRRGNGGASGGRGTPPRPDAARGNRKATKEQIEAIDELYKDAMRHAVAAAANAQLATVAAAEADAAAAIEQAAVAEAAAKLAEAEAEAEMEAQKARELAAKAKAEAAAVAAEQDAVRAKEEAADLARVAMEMQAKAQAALAMESAAAHAVALKAAPPAPADPVLAAVEEAELESLRAQVESLRATRDVLKAEEAMLLQEESCMNSAIYVVRQGLSEAESALVDAEKALAALERCVGIQTRTKMYVVNRVSSPQPVLAQNAVRAH